MKIQQLLAPIGGMVNSRWMRFAQKLRAGYHGLFHSFGREVYIGAGCLLEGTDITIGNEVTVDAGSVLVAPIQLGNHIYVNRHCVISSGVTLEDNVLIGYNSVIFGDSRTIGDDPDCRGERPSQAPVVIEKGVMLGANVTVMPGVRIGAGTVIAAGSVVTAYCEPNSVYGGNPARKLKSLPVKVPAAAAVQLPQEPLSPDGVLLVFPDMIGDYLLFRNHLAEVGKQLRAQGRPLYFVGYAPVKAIVEFLDPDLADRFFWIQSHAEFMITTKKLLKLPLLSRQWKRQIAAMGLPQTVSEIWCPSTAPWVVGGLTRTVQAKRKVGKNVQDNMFSRIQHWIYDTVFTPASFYNFIFDQHAAFFETATGVAFDNVPFTFPCGAFQGQAASLGLNQPYCVLFLDSAETYKEWPPSYFAEAIRHILDNSSLQVMLCGHGDKRYLGDEVCQRLERDPRVVNLMGKTTLVNVFDVIGAAAFVVCNDSFALHAANAMGRPILCLTQGLYLGRYLPYPQEYRRSEHLYAYSPDGQALSALTPQAIIPHLDHLLAETEILESPVKPIIYKD